MLGLLSFPSVLTQLPRERAIRSNTRSPQPYFGWICGYSEALLRLVAGKPAQEAAGGRAAGRPAVQEAPRAPHERPGGVRPRPRSTARPPARLSVTAGKARSEQARGRDAANRPSTAPAAAMADRERGRCARGLLAACSPPAHLPARSPPPRDPPRRQRPTRSTGTGEGIPAARSAEPPGWARRGAAGSPLSRAAAAGGAAEAAPIRARGGAGRDGPGPAGEVRGTPPPRRARHRAARARQRRRSADRLRARGRAGAAEERLGARSPPFGPVLFVGPWCLPRGSQLSAGPEISILSRILFRTSVLSSECSQALTHHTIVESQNALG